MKSRQTGYFCLLSYKIFEIAPAREYNEYIMERKLTIMKDIQEKKTDRRVKYTKMVVKESFVKLLKKKPISKITIKEICEEADINRATFYAHYTDQYQLLTQLENELIDEINAYLASFPYHSGDEAVSVELLAKIFEYIKENGELCSVLLSDSGDISFQKKVMKVVQTRCISEWTAIKSLSKDDAEYIYTFTAIGSVGIIQKWLNDGMKISPAYMAETVLKIANKGLSAF